MEHAVRDASGEWTNRICLVLSVTLSVLFGMPGVSEAQWPQWGGPDRSFSVDSRGLAASWPESGPRKIWSRELGDGYSAVSVDSGRLFTMYRDGDQDVVTALDEKTGETLWEHKYDAPFKDGMAMEFGPGPHATPVVVGDRVYTIGCMADLCCLDAKSGKVIWSRDLVEDFGVPAQGRGYAASPVAYKDKLLLPAGGEGQAVLALNLEDGSVAWKRHDFQVTHSSPIVISVDGEDQAVFFMGSEVIGISPDNGDLLWSIPFETQFGANITTPVWCGDNVLFCSAAYGSGSRGIRLVRKDGKTTPEELWHSKKYRIHFGTAVHVGDYVFGSSGDMGPAFMFAVHAKTGKHAWRDRDYLKANLVYGDGKLIFLDEDGNLMLAEPDGEGLNVRSKVKLLERNAWTVPTLASDRLYVRDRKGIMALDLSASGSGTDT